MVTVIPNIVQLDLETRVGAERWQLDQDDPDALHPEVRERYFEGKYNERLTKEQWEEAGNPDSGYNGSAASISRLELAVTDEGIIVKGTVLPSRFDEATAYQSAIDQRELSPEELNERSPNMLNVSFITVVEYKGKHYIAAQIKGPKVVGGGSIHAALSAGGVLGDNLGDPHYLQKALWRETIEEIGISTADLDTHSAAFVVDERDIMGYVNIASVARGAKLEEIIPKYEAKAIADLKGRKPMEKLEVGGIALIPLEGYQRGQVNGEDGLLGVQVFMPTKDGLVQDVQDRVIRPYTAAVLDYLEDPANVAHLLKKAGYQA